MSRIGRKPIDVPAGVDVQIADDAVTLRGPQGEIKETLPAGIRVREEGGRLIVERGADDKATRSLHGLVRALLRNHVVGVTEGYRQQLEIVGVSYQANSSGTQLTLKVGYANDVVLTIPEGVKVEVPNPTAIILTGADRHAVGQFGAIVRAARPPEPYKGKGIRYRGEHIQRKQGKSFVGTE